MAPADVEGRIDPRKAFRSALRAMVCSDLPAEIAVRTGPLESKHDGFVLHRAILGRKDEKDAVPCVGVIGSKFTGEKVVVWAHPGGKSSVLSDGKLVPVAKAILDAGFAIVAADLFGTGEQVPKPTKVDATYAGYTFGYNRTPLANRVHDLLTVLAFGQSMLKAKTLHLVGWGEAGPWAALARALAGDAVAKTAVDLNRFAFENVQATDDPMLLPCALKYGGLPNFIRHATGAGWLVHNDAGPNPFPSPADKTNTHSGDRWADDKVAAWLVS